MNEGDYLDIAEASELLGLSQSTVYEQIRSGKLPAITRPAPTTGTDKYFVSRSSIVSYQERYPAKAKRGGRAGYFGGGHAHTYNIGASQLRELFHIYHSIVLVTEQIADPLLVASATKLQEFLFKIPGSEHCNPRRDIPAESVNDWGALK